MLVSDILKTKGSDVVSTGPDATIVETARLLKARGIRAALVRDGDGQLIGVISERDIIRGIAMHGEGALAKHVRDLMTSDVITCTPTETVSEVMETFSRHRFHHLPVMDDGEIKGIISIGDVVKHHIEDLMRQIRASRVTPLDEGNY